MKNTITNLCFLGGLILSLLFLSACTAGYGKLFVTNPLENAVPSASITIVEGKSPTPAEQDIKEYFEKQLSNTLFEKHFRKGTDLKLVYSFIQYDPGSRFLRWLLGGGIFHAGTGTVRIQVKYLDSNGKELSTVEAEGTISSGIFGGSFEFAIDKTVTEIAQYTIQKFK